MSLIIPANTLASGGFAVDNSLRFNDDSSDYLNLSLGTPSNRKIFTCSAWVKRASTGTYPIFWFGADSDNWFMVKYESDSLRIESKSSGSTIIDVRTNALYRDFSAWYHVLVAVDTSQGTASNRIKIYVNGVQETSLQTSTYPNQNTDLNVITTAEIGNQHTTQYFDGYMAEVVFVDGTAQANTDLGEFDEDSGIWKPIDVSGLTFGTNGFYLDFEDSAALGDDVSGNGNDFTVNNLTAIDQTTDTPTNNFATFNSAQPALANTSFSEGNLVATTNSSASTQVPFATTIPVSTGKWYAEFKMIAKSTSSGSIPYIGVLGAANFVSKLDNAYFVGGANLDGVGYGASGVVYSNSSELDSSEASFDDGDIISVAADITNRKIYFAKNGTYINSGNPAAAANGYTIPTTSESFYIFSASLFGASGSWGANFGSPPYAISSGNTDGNGYGNFEYEVPSGYLSLCTANLSEVLG
jgi:hypothetical protein